MKVDKSHFKNKEKANFDLIRLNGESPAWQPQNRLPENVRRQMIKTMQDRLSDSFELMLRAKNSHWNIKGPNFLVLHRFFDEIAEAVNEFTDLIAERIIQLGGTARGTLQYLTITSNSLNHSQILTTQEEHLADLSKALAAFCEETRRLILQAEQLNDPVTMDIFVKIAKKSDVLLWYIEAHCEKDSLANNTSSDNTSSSSNVVM